MGAAMRDYEDWKIILDVPARDPKLGFDRFGQAIAEVILHSEPRFAVGIFGGWGSGKTTLMNKIRSSLEASQKTTIVTEFSAWRYEKEEHLIIPLLDSIREAMMTWKTDNKTLKTKLEKVAKTIGGVTESLISGLAFKVGLGDAVSMSFNANQALRTAEKLDDEEKMKSVPRSPYFASFEALKGAFRDFAGSKDDGNRIIVFIDDLDRCLPKGALQVIESMKLFFDLPGFVFVVGLDREIVEWCIDANYRGKTNGEALEEQAPGQVSGADYIKKIFQVPFALSPVSTNQIDEFLDAAIVEADLPISQQEEIRNIIRPHLGYLVTESGVNPRELKRYINAYTLTMKTKPTDSLIDGNVVLAIQTLAFVEEWQFVYEALLGSREIFIDALRKRVIEGNVAALRSYDTNLAAIPPRLIDYLALDGFAGDPSPGNDLLHVPNLDEYIHLGTASLTTDESGNYQRMLELIGRFRDLREPTLAVVRSDGSINSSDVQSVHGEIRSIGGELGQFMYGSAVVETRRVIDALSASLEIFMPSEKKVSNVNSTGGEPSAPPDWAETVNARFDEALSIFANFLRDERTGVRRHYSSNRP